MTMRTPKLRLRLGLLALLTLPACDRRPAPFPEAGPAPVASTASAAPIATASADPPASATAAPVVTAPPARPALEPRRQLAMDWVDGLSRDVTAYPRDLGEKPALLRSRQARHKKECAAKDMLGCLAYAVLTEQLHGSTDLATEEYAKACEAGEQIACARLALFWDCDRPAGPDDADRVCPTAANVRLSDPVPGEGEPRQSPQLQWLHLCRAVGQRACDADVPAGCIAVASSYAGESKADTEKVKGLFERGCDLGSWAGCAGGMYFSQDLEKRKKGDPRAQLWEEAFAKRRFWVALALCEGKAPLECDIVAEDYQSGTGVTKDLDKARSYFKRACDARVAAGLAVHPAFGDACKKAEQLDKK